MSKKLSFAIAINLLTEGFKKGANTVKNQLRSIQMQIITFAAALGAGGIGLMGLISRMKDVARETSRATTALKNVSGGTALFADNLKFLNALAKKYGVEINTLTFNFAKFKAAGDSVGMSLADQRKIFESTSRAAVAYGMSAEDTNLTFLAITQMMSKGKISSEELRRQLGERLPIAMAAMAKAAGVPINQLDTLLKQSKLLSADVLPKFADALNEMIPNVNTDNIETSMSRLSNVFTKFTEAAGVGAKFKAIIDGLTVLVEAAGKNIQNIVLGIVAAIVFAVSNGATKVYRSYAVTGQQIIANAQVAETKRLAATAARVEAEIALDKAKSAAILATDRQRLQAANAIAKAETALRGRVLAETKAIEAAKVASAQAAAIKTGGVWATAGAAIKGTFLKLTTALKSMWNTFAPAIIITAIITVIGYFKNLYDEARRIRNIFSDYQKEIKSIDYGQEIKVLQTQLSIINDKKRGVEDISAAEKELNKLLGVEEKNHEELNKLVAKRVELIKATAEADFFARKAIEAEAKKEELVEKKNTLVKEERSQNVKGTALIRTFLGNDVAGFLGLDTTDKVQAEIDQQIKIAEDANKRLESLQVTANKLTTTNTDPTPKADKTIDKRLEARQWLINKRAELDNQVIQNQLESEQKALDLQQDSFDKKFAQNELNFRKELVQIADWENDIAKIQQEAAKKMYVERTGSDKGFDFSAFDLSTLPEGLRPGDVEKEVEQRNNAALTAWRKGNTDIREEQATFIQEERLRFASHLEQQLADINNYYKERLKSVGKGSDEEKILLENQSKDVRLTRLDATKKQLEFEAEYNQTLQDLINDRYVFDADNRAASIRQELKDNEKRIENAEDTFKAITGFDYNSLDESQLAGLTEKYPELASAIRLARLEQERLNKELGKAKGQKLSELIGIANELSDTLSVVTGADLNIFSDGLNMLGSFAQKDIMGGISSGLSLISSIASGIIGNAEREAEIKRQILKLQQEYNISLREQNYELISSIDYARVFRDNLEALHWLVEKGFISDTHFTAWQALSEQAKVAKENAKEAMSEYDKLNKQGSDWLKDFDNGILQMMNGSVREALKVWKEGLANGDKNAVLNALRILAAGGWSFSDKARDYADQLERADGEVTKLTDGLAELTAQMDEFATGTNFDGFLSDTMSAIDELRKGVSDLGDFTEKTLTNAILSSFKYKILAEALNPMYNELANLFIADALDVNTIKMWSEDFNALLKEYAAKLGIAFEAVGIDSSSDFSQDSSKGYSASMDQDTGGAILGRITGLHEVGLRMESLLGGIAATWGSSDIFSQNASMNNELQKQTVLLDEIKQIQTKSFFQVEEMNVTLKEASGKLDRIDKNTKGL